MFMDFTLHFYIIFGTNLLTGGPTRIVVFFADFSVSKKRNIKQSRNGTNSTGEVIFWKESYRMDLDPTSGAKGGAHEGGGAPTPRGRAGHPRGRPVHCLTSTPSLVDCVCSKKIAPDGFIPFGHRFIFLFFETLKIGKKTAIRAGPPVSRLVPKMI